MTDPKAAKMFDELIVLFGEIADAIQQAVNEERERRAKIADAIEDSMAQAIAERIRATGGPSA